MKLSTGKEVYANFNIFGLTPDGQLTEGYDTFMYEDFDDEDRKDRLTPEEKSEIADEMIKRWTAYRERFARIQVSPKAP